MKEKNMNKAALALVTAALFLMSSCAGIDNEINTDAYKLSVRLIATDSGSRNIFTPGDLKGIYFGELEIVAYSYRPGESVQSVSGFGGDGVTPGNWSYWIALQSGHAAGRDNVLAQSGQIDFNALNGDYGRSLDEDYVENVGEFRVDFFEVNTYRTGIVIGERYYGMNAEENGMEGHPLHKYPEWSDYEDYFTSPVFPGVGDFEFGDDQSLSVLFARDDWFPEPVLIQMEWSNPYVIERSSIALTPVQKELIENLVSEGTGRRFYGRFVVIPFAGPHVYTLDGTPPTVSVDFNLTSAVNFDLSNLVDVSWTVPVPEDENLKVVYTADADGIPFGLSISFD
jgi:hypothetical protein